MVSGKIRDQFREFFGSIFAQNTSRDHLSFMLCGSHFGISESSGFKDIQLPFILVLHDYIHGGQHALKNLQIIRCRLLFG